MSSPAAAEKEKQLGSSGADEEETSILTDIDSDEQLSLLLVRLHLDISHTLSE